MIIDFIISDGNLPLVRKFCNAIALQHVVYNAVTYSILFVKSAITFECMLQVQSIVTPFNVVTFDCMVHRYQSILVNTELE